MERKKSCFVMADIFYIALMILPMVAGMVLKVLTTPMGEGIQISGAQIYYSITFPIQNLVITSAQINSWLVMVSILGLCLYLTHGLKTRSVLRRQHLAEWIVENVEKLVRQNMGDYFSGFSAFIAAIIALSAFSSLLALLGMFPPTSDLNVVAGWAVVAFVLITYYKMKCGPVTYIKNLASPILLTPLNVIGEVATPVSMAFRHYGNVLSGSVISVLVAAGLQGLSHIILGWLPGFLGEFPLFQIGIPAILSIYFDVFSGCLQAYIFAMLTMMYVADGFPMEEYLMKKNKKYTQEVM